MSFIEVEELSREPETLIRSCKIKINGKYLDPELSKRWKVLDSIIDYYLSHEPKYPLSVVQLFYDGFDEKKIEEECAPM